ncbi:uncharacterized protein BDR25DRAFT_121439 [Lindgomyces ingoldianus]|uniref:Uncharacterized protein n=1 Tax=Lindgomyces ingoldianus TaxID=673940 RepID=A0ACB6R524_9PLEO|nr:uncharacterized protein BDR25DRAFT_121439 [Lindgomyces ingoldianus]KAF2474373.1 hypothetical protein BDR25DRAFT_121439 [Lindgomyces ingoldianus]
MPASKQPSHNTTPHPLLSLSLRFFWLGHNVHPLPSLVSLTSTNCDTHIKQTISWQPNQNARALPLSHCRLRSFFLRCSGFCCCGKCQSCLSPQSPILMVHTGWRCRYYGAETRTRLHPRWWLGTEARACIHPRWWLWTEARACIHPRWWLWTEARACIHPRWWLWTEARACIHPRWWLWTEARACLHPRWWLWTEARACLHPRWWLWTEARACLHPRWWLWTEARACVHP